MIPDMISVVHTDNIWNDNTISTQLIAEASENRLAELDWEYGR